MKRMIVLFGALLISSGLLVACSSSSDSEISDEITPKEQEKNEIDDRSSGNFQDQTNLKIGDSGQAESTLGQYEITIESVKMVDELDGEVPMFDHLFITDVTIKNIGDVAIDATETIDSLELTDSLDGSGAGDYSSYYSSITPLTGTIEPGQSITGQAVFEGRESGTYFIRVISGLIAAGGVKNETTWTFDKTEAE
ncbi:DUF4352 domain-containing protein [Sporosarcina sp. ACRSM]|uniref:DUF4352 domain-containing protein n=1 Tax=Sporosarcina sp. ACRSM TaxID=2918216 RepID=UPI001EF61028|nr:DUF4352 domain-containing protein [Sporosarcina sp. ACRSM]MCG7334945.1 DUF4352 domain-containing protein [Sporosarcina sp. ACRSM]